MNPLYSVAQVIFFAYLLLLASFSIAEDRVDSLTPFLTIAPGAQVQVGIVGIDLAHDAEPVAVFRIQQQGVSTVFGKGPEGILFDFRVTQAIMDGLSYSLATRNHGWESHGFFYDNKVAINSINRLFETDSSSFKLHPEVFLAYSNQRLDGDLISGLRLGFGLRNEFSQDLDSFGKFRLVNRNSFNYYPVTSDWQYGLRLQPSWSVTVVDNRFVTSYDFQLTNGASPFDGNVDRLVDINTLNLVWHYEPKLEVSSFKNTFGVSINWLKDASKEQSGLRSAYWIVDTRQVIDRLIWELRLELQAAAFLAPVLTPVEDADLRASLKVNTDVYYNDWRYHFSSEYKFVHPDNEKDIELFELGFGPVFEFDSQIFRPYLAFNFAEFLFNEGALDSIAVSAIGFEVLQ